MKKLIKTLIMSLIVLLSITAHSFAWTLSSAKIHTAKYEKSLNAKNFYKESDRQQKIIAVRAMMALDGNNFTEREEGNGYWSIYLNKGICYFYLPGSNSQGLMTLKKLEIMYMHPETGKILITHTIK